jgi:hypothetical protein
MSSAPAAQQPRIFYLEASALVKRYLAEIGSAWVEARKDWPPRTPTIIRDFRNAIRYVELAGERPRLTSRMSMRMRCQHLPQHPDRGPRRPAAVGCWRSVA